MNAPAHLRRKPDEDLRYFGVCLTPTTANLMLAKAKKEGVTISELIERVVIQFVVKDAEVRG